ncbi:hypothetical protein BDN71DRAFT_1564216, partial [Pleurotus eryngii]
HSGLQYTQGDGEDTLSNMTDSWLEHQVDNHLEVLTQCMATEFPDDTNKIHDMATSMRDTLISAYCVESAEVPESEDEVRAEVADEKIQEELILESEDEVQAEMSRFDSPSSSDRMEEDAICGPSTQDEDNFLSTFQRQAISLTDAQQDKHSASASDSDMDYSQVEHYSQDMDAPPCAQPITESRWIPLGRSHNTKFSCFAPNFLFPFDFATISWQVERRLFKSVYGFWSSAYLGALRSIRRDPYDEAIFPTLWLAKHYGQVHGLQPRKKIKLFLSRLFTLNKELKARAQQLAEVFNHWRFIACWADTNCLRLPTEEQEKELLRKGQEVLLTCVDEFLENYMHSRIAHYTKLASDALEEAYASLKPDLKKKIQKLVQRDVLVWVLMSKMKVALSYNKMYGSQPL